MSYVLNNDAAKLLSATLTGTTLTATQAKLLVFRAKFATIDGLDILAELTNGSNLIMNVNAQTGVGTEGYFTPNSFATEWTGTLAGESTGSWQLLSCFMPANSNGASLTIRHDRDGSNQTATNTGTADTGNMMNFAIGHASLPPDMLICEVGIFLPADVTAAAAIHTALYGGGFGRRLDAIGSVAAPTYYWPLLDNLNAVAGSPALTNTGSVASSTDMPTLRPRGRVSLLGVGAP